MLFVTRASWFTSDHELKEVSVANDVEVLPCRNHPTMSVLWLRDPAVLTKSLTCSECGTGAKAYWSCSDDGCPLSLCPRCYSTARLPGENRVTLPEVEPLVQRRPAPAPGNWDPLRFQLAPPSPCALLRPTPSPDKPPPFPDRVRAGQAVDRSHVLIPFATVALLGLGEDQRFRGSAGTHYTFRSDLFNIGYGCYPFVVSWHRHTTEQQVAHSVFQTAKLLSDTRVERLLIDLRCHQTATGYGFGYLEYDALRILRNLVQPFLSAFRVSKQVSRSPLQPTDVFILFNCCCTAVDSFCTLLDDFHRDTGFAVHLLLFTTPLLVFDIDSVTPFVLPPFTNRLERRTLHQVLLSVLSEEVRSSYRPVLLSPPADGSSGYSCQPLFAAAPAPLLLPSPGSAASSGAATPSGGSLVVSGTTTRAAGSRKRRAAAALGVAGSDSGAAAPSESSVIRIPDDIKRRLVDGDLARGAVATASRVASAASVETARRAGTLSLPTSLSERDARVHAGVRASDRVRLRRLAATQPADQAIVLLLNLRLSAYLGVTMPAGVSIPDEWQVHLEGERAALDRPLIASIQKILDQLRRGYEVAPEPVLPEPATPAVSAASVVVAVPPTPVVGLAFPPVSAAFVRTARAQPPLATLKARDDRLGALMATLPLSDRQRCAALAVTPADVAACINHYLSGLYGVPPASPHLVCPGRAADVPILTAFTEWLTNAADSPVSPLSAAVSARAEAVSDPVGTLAGTISPAAVARFLADLRQSSRVPTDGDLEARNALLLDYVRTLPVRGPLVTAGTGELVNFINRYLPAALQTSRQLVPRSLYLNLSELAPLDHALISSLREVLYPPASGVATGSVSPAGGSAASALVLSDTEATDSDADVRILPARGSPAAVPSAGVSLSAASPASLPPVPESVLVHTVGERNVKILAYLNALPSAELASASLSVSTVAELVSFVNSHMAAALGYGPVPFPPNFVMTPEADRVFDRELVPEVRRILDAHRPLPDPGAVSVPSPPSAVLDAQLVERNRVVGVHLALQHPERVAQFRDCLGSPSCSSELNCLLEVALRRSFPQPLPAHLLVAEPVTRPADEQLVQTFLDRVRTASAAADHPSHDVLVSRLVERNDLLRRAVEARRSGHLDVLRGAVECGDATVSQYLDSLLPSLYGYTALNRMPPFLPLADRPEDREVELWLRARLFPPAAAGAPAAPAAPAAPSAPHP